MRLKRAYTKSRTWTHKHQSTLLCAAAVVGVASTAYLTAKASFAAAKDLEEVDEDLPFKEKAQLVWKYYIPASISGVTTVSSIYGVLRTSQHKTAAAQAALALSERAFSEYKEKVIEQIGPRKEQKIRDEINEDLVEKSPPDSALVIAASPGNVLCMEKYSGRYFLSDMETLKKAENLINSKMLKHDEQTLLDFYYEVGLPETMYSSNVGWQSDRLMELIFTAVVGPDGKPVLVFEYNYTKQL